MDRENFLLSNLALLLIEQTRSDFKQTINNNQTQSKSQRIKQYLLAIPFETVGLIFEQPDIQV